MSMDGTMDFGADPGAATTLAAGSGAGTDLEGVMRMVRELATRVGDLETRLEDAVDAKERLERQVAAQTEELRVQRAAIARTQRAVRNLSQSVEETPTEPAPRVPSPSE
jgi:septal ring factor EnvC (AmiA/AmiB activator)